MDVIAATPSTLAEPRVLSHKVRNAGGPAEMKSADEDSSASFMAAGPPRSIQRTVKSPRPDSAAYFSIRRYFSITRSGRNPTPPAPLGIRTSCLLAPPPHAVNNASASAIVIRTFTLRPGLPPESIPPHLPFHRCASIARGLSVLARPARPPRPDRETC